MWPRGTYVFSLYIYDEQKIVVYYPLWTHPLRVHRTSHVLVCSTVCKHGEYVISVSKTLEQQVVRDLAARPLPPLNRTKCILCELSLYGPVSLESLTLPAVLLQRYERPF